MQILPQAPGAGGDRLLVFWQSQISVLQNRIEQLEQLLEENHEIISHIKESVLELTAHAEAPPALLPYYTANGSWVVLPEPRPSFFSVAPQDCQFALGGRGQKPELQVGARAGRGPPWWPWMGAELLSRPPDADCVRGAAL